MRGRYQEFYPKNSKNAILRSSNVDRVLDTISLVGGQLWPPTGECNWTQPRVFHLPMPFDGVLNNNFLRIFIQLRPNLLFSLFFTLLTVRMPIKIMKEISKSQKLSHLINKIKHFMIMYLKILEILPLLTERGMHSMWYFLSKRMDLGYQSG